MDESHSTDTNKREADKHERLGWPGTHAAKRPALGRKLLSVCLIAIAAVLGLRAPDAAAGPVTPRFWEPAMVNGYAKGWPGWSFVGVNLPAVNDKADAAVVSGLAHWTSAYWGGVCTDPWDTTPSKIGLQRRIPMIWGKADFDNPAQMNALFNGPCNDGRPLFFLNEPDYADQSNLTPAIAADMFYAMTRGDWPRKRWSGPIYAGGVELVHSWWVDQFLDAFATRYNRGYKMIPEIKGWQMHTYANWGGITMDAPLSALTDAAFDQAMALARQRTVAFIAQRRAEHNSTKIYFNETGFLTHVRAGMPDGTPEQYSQRMAVLLQKQDAMMRTLRPDVEGWEWFSSYAGNPYCTTDCKWKDFNASNLAYADGTLTPAGAAWRALAARQ